MRLQQVDDIDMFETMVRLRKRDDQQRRWKVRRRVQEEDASSSFSLKPPEGPKLKCNRCGKEYVVEHRFNKHVAKHQRREAVDKRLAMLELGRNGEHLVNVDTQEAAVVLDGDLQEEDPLDVSIQIVGAEKRNHVLTGITPAPPAKKLGIRECPLPPTPLVQPRSPLLNSPFSFGLSDIPSLPGPNPFSTSLTTRQTVPSRFDRLEEINGANERGESNEFVIVMNKLKLLEEAISYTAGENNKRLDVIVALLKGEVANDEPVPNHFDVEVEINEGPDSLTPGPADPPGPPAQADIPQTDGANSQDISKEVSKEASEAIEDVEDVIDDSEDESEDEDGVLDSNIHEKDDAFNNKDLEDQVTDTVTDNVVKKPEAQLLDNVEPSTRKFRLKPIGRAKKIVIVGDDVINCAELIKLRRLIPEASIAMPGLDRLQIPFHLCQ